ncbi:MAG: transglycosylase SLT domain-containing protein [bacterium]
MSIGNRLSLVALAVCVLTAPLGGGIFDKPNAEQVRLQKELNYYREATLLNDLLFKEGIPVHMNIVIVMLKEIDKNIATYYPNGPFTRTDFMALGWLESEYKQFERGTHGERGIFQIMPCEFKDYDVHKNYYNVDINTQMAFRVMQTKFDKHHDYKMAIMAYNGLVKVKGGHFSQKYWKAFEKRKLAIEMVLAAQQQ